LIRASLVALLARQRLVVSGLPGIAKSALVTELYRWISPQNGAGRRNFAYLMTRFPTPEEIFKASSAILNALLKIANERVFHNGDGDGDRRWRVSTMSPQARQSGQLLDSASATGWVALHSCS
jgi:MoxR-like ATPase